MSTATATNTPSPPALPSFLDPSPQPSLKPITNLHKASELARAVFLETTTISLRLYLRYDQVWKQHLHETNIPHARWSAMHCQKIQEWSVLALATLRLVEQKDSGTLAEMWRVYSPVV